MRSHITEATDMANVTALRREMQRYRVVYSDASASTCDVPLRTESVVSRRYENLGETTREKREALLLHPRVLSRATLSSRLHNQSFSRSNVTHILRVSNEKTW